MIQFDFFFFFFLSFFSSTHSSLSLIQSWSERNKSELFSGYSEWLTCASSANILWRIERFSMRHVSGVIYKWTAQGPAQSLEKHQSPWTFLLIFGRLWGRIVSYQKSKLRAVPQMPKSRLRRERISWSVVSNAAERSKCKRIKMLSSREVRRLLSIHCARTGRQTDRCWAECVDRCDASCWRTRSDTMLD